MAIGVESAGVEGNILVEVIQWVMLGRQIAETLATSGTTHVMTLVGQTIRNVSLLAIGS